MTRQEFIDNVVSWPELLEFCSDNECGECDNVYDADQRDESIDRNLVSMARGAEGWSDLYHILDDIPVGYDYYEDTDADGWRGLDDYDDFQRYKEYVAEWMDNGEYWDDEYEEDDEEEQSGTPYYESRVTDEDGISVEDESIPVYELFALCNSQLQSIDSK